MSYSEELAKKDAQLAARVRAILIKNCDAFVTLPVSDGISGQMTYLKAMRNPESGLWAVRDVTAAAKTDGGYLLNTSTKTSGLCFFDALYYLAQRQYTQMNLGKTEVTDAPVLDALGLSEVMTYRNAALKAGQPLDHAGLPMPAAFGDILVDGVYDDAAMRVAARAPAVQLSTSLVPAVQASDLMASFTDRAPALAGNGGTVSGAAHLKYSKAIALRDIVVSYIAAQVEPAVYRSEKDKKGWRFARDHRYDDEEVVAMPVMAGGILGSVGGASAAFAVGAMFSLAPAAAIGVGFGFAAATIGGFHKMTRADFRFGASTLKARFAIAVLPAGPEKDALRENIKMARATFELEASVAEYIRFEETGKTRVVHLKRAEKRLRAGMKILGVDGSVTQGMVNRLYQGDFFRQGYFLRALKDATQNVKHPLLGGASQTPKLM